MPNRRYTKRQKITAVVAAELTSGLAASQSTGISETNIRRWRDDPELAKYVDKTRDELADGTHMLAHRALEQIMLKLPDFEPRDLVTLFGVMVDKAQLLSGAATSRTENRDITGSLTDTDVLAALAAAEDYARPSGSGTPTPAEVAPEG
jgi:hypothetical protein